MLSIIINGLNESRMISYVTCNVNNSMVNSICTDKQNNTKQTNEQILVHKIEILKSKFYAIVLQNLGT